MGDPFRLNQILLNLVSNSIKFTEKGSVMISTQVIQENCNTQKIIFMVEDTGIGMDGSFVKNLFQKFTQEDDSVTRKFGGTGLGMSICRELVEILGGEIFVESKKGEGTKVSFELEFVKGREDDLPQKDNAPVNLEILSGKKILLADDNEMNRLVAETILKQYGAEILEATNGDEAVNAIVKYEIDLVLMDVQMPVMNGLEATGIIRKGLRSEIPIIALTANAIKGENQRCLNAGMNDYLSKPFEEEQLVQIVSRWLGKKPPVLPETEKKTQPEKLFDLGKMQDFSRGNPEMVEKMIRLFCVQGPESVKEMEEALACKKFEKVKSIAHRFLPSAINMGIFSQRDPLEEIERLAGSSGIAEANEKQERLAFLVRRLGEVIGEVVRQLPVPV